MAIGVGSRIGPYEVIALLGQGGMGKVWRARHTALKRDDALKVLPDAFASDSERVARFQREAQILASLNHPNIAHLYGLEQADRSAGSGQAGVQALVMELVEGLTLADRVAQGPIPLDEALAIAKQIAEALEGAHEQGIIHRDLKPANVKVRPDGIVKVLDFGLAKALDSSPAAMGVSQSPTITSPAMMTSVGVLLGTAAYMSPEQVRGMAVDKRSDVWAFGCVLYEMLTGRRAFADQEVSDVLVSVLTREPDWRLLPAGLSPVLATYIKRCLHKDRKQRVGDAQSVRLALEGAFETATRQTSSPMVATEWRRVALTNAVTAIAASLITGATVWSLTRPTPPPLVRTEVTTTDATALSIQGAVRDLAITPDGSRIIYRGQGKLLVRALDRLTPTPLTGLGAPRSVFVSPDGQWIGFFDTPSTLKKVAITGGPPVTLARVDGAADRGATWGADDTIVYATNGSATGLQRVSAAGGESSVLTKPNRELGEADHVWPEFLPGAEAVLFTITSANGNLDTAQIAVLDLRTNTQTVLVRGGSHAHYVPSGHLVFGAGGTLRAVRFDLARLAVVGTPVPVLEQVATTELGALDAVVATNGTLAYVSGGIAVAQRTLVWVDRAGREEPTKVPPRAYAYAQISPDGSRVALDIRDEQEDIWIWDLAREALQRLTFDPGLNRGPVWTPDGKRVAFSRAVGDAVEEVYWQAADGSGMAEPLTEGSKFGVVPSDFSPEATTLLYEPIVGPRDIGIVTIGSRATVGMPLLASPAEESGATVSPDGRWLAYRSNESGRDEIYVRPFPAVNTGRWQISTGGGDKPRWRRDGRELYYVAQGATTSALMAVSIKPGPGFAAGTPAMLFQGNYLAPQAGRQVYDVSPDGKRFLMIKPALAPGTAPRLVVVQNWDQELKRLVPTR